MVNKIKRQASLPSLPVGVLEVLIFGGVFLICGSLSLNGSLSDMIIPTLLFSAVMMLSMILSGVYQTEIARSIVQLHRRTALGYSLATVMMLLLAGLSSSEFFHFKFVAIAFLFSFIVISTVRPVISDDLTRGAWDRRSH